MLRIVQLVSTGRGVIGASTIYLNIREYTYIYEYIYIVTWDSKLLSFFLSVGENPQFSHVGPLSWTVYMYMYTYIYVYIYVCVFVCICIYV